MEPPLQDTVGNHSPVHDAPTVHQVPWCTFTMCQVSVVVMLQSCLQCTQCDSAPSQCTTHQSSSHLACIHSELPFERIPKIIFWSKNHNTHFQGAISPPKTFLGQNVTRWMGKHGMSETMCTHHLWRITILKQLLFGRIRKNLFWSKNHNMHFQGAISPPKNFFWTECDQMDGKTQKVRNNV